MGTQHVSLGLLTMVSMVSKFFWCASGRHCNLHCLLLLLQMGLGKTAQSIAVMAWLKQYGQVSGPFMVVAPLTTLGHWQREIETWTGMVSDVVGGG